MLGRLTKNPLLRYFQEAREELRKVTWPSQQEVILYSSLVIIISVVMAAYLGLLDWIFTLGLEELVKLTNQI